MKTKPNPAAIGMFITGAAVIIVLSVLLFSSGRLFRSTKSYLLTFQEPVTGLDAGAPVKMLGVTIGEVSEVWLGVNPTNQSPMINVVIDVDRQTAETKTKDYHYDLDDRANFERSVRERGLRGQLATLSLLSGRLYIALEHRPDETGFQLNREAEHGYWEIPTVPSATREMMMSVTTTLDNLAQLDLRGISEELKGLLNDIRESLAEIEFGKVNNRLVSSLDEVDSLLSDPNLKSALTNLNLTLKNAGEVTGKLNREVNPLLTDIRSGVTQAGEALEEATAALDGLNRQIQPGSPLSDELLTTLERAGRAIDAIRELAQELQRNPNSIITGKPTQKP